MLLYLTIIDKSFIAKNLKLVSEAIQNVTILNGYFIETFEYATENTLFYFEPPNKLLSKTSSFNYYAKDEFDDSEQIHRDKEIIEFKQEFIKKY